MGMKATLSVGTASLALLLGGCVTQDETPEFTQIAIEGSDIQSVPTPLEPLEGEGESDELYEVSDVRVAREGDVPPPPPPPPAVSAAPATEAAGEGDRGVVTGSRVRRSEFSSISPVEIISGEVSRDSGLISDPLKPAPTGKSRPQPEPQSGLLTAGDYDDELNLHLYKEYLEKTQAGELAQKRLPYVDAADRIEIRITDRLG